MCLTDYNWAHKTVGRIEIVEESTFGLVHVPENFGMDKEEIRYGFWLRTVIDGITAGNEQNDLVLRNIYFHGVPSEMGLLVPTETQKELLQ